MTLDRRLFLSMLGATPLVQGSGQAAGPDQPALVIDCHAHIYGEDEATYPTIENPYRPPPGKGTVSHLLEEMRAHGVSKATAIQTSTYYRWDNRFLTDSARERPDVMVGVCTLNPDDPGSPALLDRYVRQSNVKAMRTIPGESGKFDAPGVDALWTAAERLGIVINVLADHDKVDEIETLARRHHTLRVMLDHGLNLKVGDATAPTLAALERLARLPNVHVKLTFIPTGTAEDYPCRDMHEPCHRVIAAFGPGRCVWGSNFPCELWCPKVGYGRHLAIFTRELGLGAAAKAAILGETARRLYFEPPA